MSVDPAPDTPRAVAEATGWRLPRRVRLALWVCGAAAALVLLALALRPLLPFTPTATPTSQDSIALECRFQGAQLGGWDAGSSSAGPSAHPGAVLSATWMPTCTRVVEANPHPSLVTMQFLLFGPFATADDVRQFIEAAHAQASQPTAVQATPGEESFGSWPLPPRAGGVQQVQTNDDTPVTVHVPLPNNLSPGLYAMYARHMQWVQVAGGWTTAYGESGIAGTLAVSAAAVTATATP